MSTTLRPHDLIWLNARDALEDVTESWVDTVWHSGLPVVVRRDVDAQGRIPVGVRGMKRDQRAAGWVKAEAVVRVCSPESLVDTLSLLRSPFISQPPLPGGVVIDAAGVAVDVGHHRQYRLCAGYRDPGDPRGKRSGSADPRASAVITRAVGQMATAGGGRALPCRYPG